MIRQVIKIDEDKCNGCGVCVNACHEGAIELIDGKAKLTRDDYCDGLGNCLPTCPTGAITFEQREADEFNEAAVLKKNEKYIQPEKLACGCPGTQMKTIARNNEKSAICENEHQHDEITSQLRQWPCQIKLVPPNAPYFNNTDLLVAADCSAYAYGNFHNQFMKNKITIIGCPKLDNIDYAEKLTAILKLNNIKSITVVRMEVPCCGGIVSAVTDALRASGKMIPWQIVTISTDGKIL